MKYLTLSVPGFGNVTPQGVPSPSIPYILQTGVTIFFILAVILALFFLVYGGIRWIISGGDKQKIAQARGTLTYAIIGLLVVFLSFFIINLIGGAFGVSLLSIPNSPFCVGDTCVTP
jgi:hypothetical protein